MPDIVFIAHNLRSCHNVGSLLRTAEGFGVSKVYLTGYTPYPQAKKDDRLPHIAQKMAKHIHKTALGAESLVEWEQRADVFAVIQQLKASGYSIAALEQTPRSLLLPDWQLPKRTAIIVGREVEGIELDVITACDVAIEIPMQGKKESFNVVQAAAITMYHCCYALNSIK